MNQARSSLRILHLGRSQHPAPNMSAELVRSTQIDLRTKHRGQLGLHHGQSNQAWLTVRLEFHQQIDVAVRPGGAHEPGAEQRQAENVLPAAELCPAMGHSFTASCLGVDDEPERSSASTRTGLPTPALGLSRGTPALA